MISDVIAERSAVYASFTGACPESIRADRKEEPSKVPSSPLVIFACIFFVGTLAAAAASDVRERRIPNRLSLGLAVGAPGFHLSAELGTASLLASALAALAVLTGGLVLFRQGWIGAGDVKLAAAAVLWLDPAAVAPFLARTALAGALVAALLVAIHWRSQPAMARGRSTAMRTGALTCPYGVAIAGGAVATFATTRLEWF